MLRGVRGVRAAALAMGDELPVVPTGRRQLEGAQLLVLSRADDTHSNGGEHQAPGEQLGQAKQHLRHLGPDGLLELLWRLAWPVGDDDQASRGIIGPNGCGCFIGKARNCTS